MEDDFKYIKKTFDLALLGIGFTSPNPLVGSVIVKDNKIIGTGYHKKAGLPHAEVEAIKNCNQSPEGSTLYCNLEPCCHINKRTPPCLDLIINSGIKRVVFSNLDPNPEVSGRTVKLLKDANINVTFGIYENEGWELNRNFFTAMVKKRPYIHLKSALSLDGRIALNNFESNWISNVEARKRVHDLRFCVDAILVGANTFIHDRPKLNSRDESGGVLKENIKIVMGSRQKVLNGLSNYKNLGDFITYTNDFYIEEKCKANFCSSDLSFENFLSKLVEIGITSILVEGGSKIIATFLEKDYWDEYSLFYSPIFAGSGISVAGESENYSKISEIKKYKDFKIEKIDDNFLVQIRN